MGSACVSQRSQAHDRTHYLQPLPRRKRLSNLAQLVPEEATNDELPDLVKDVTGVPEKLELEPSIPPKPLAPDAPQSKRASLQKTSTEEHQAQLIKVRVAQRAIPPAALHNRRGKHFIKKKHLQKYAVRLPKMVEESSNGEDHGGGGESSLQQEDLYSDPTRYSAPRITFLAPQFKATAVVEGEFKTIQLSDYEGKYVVLFFYPQDFTFVCPTEILAFSEAAKKFRDIECEVIACSCDSHFCHLAFTNTPKKEGGLGSVDIPLISDATKDIARKYGVLKEDEGVAFRGLFIIDRKQRLRQKTINDIPVGRSVDETLRLVQAFQFTDIHGEVCPAGWRPGKDTIKPDAKKKKEYFEKQNADKEKKAEPPAENAAS